MGIFLSTPSARRATRGHPERCSSRLISIHALREEGDVIDQQAEIDSYLISIHALREEGDLRKRKDWSTRMISIHALREEGDLLFLHTKPNPLISIHALREEGDNMSILST